MCATCGCGSGDVHVEGKPVTEEGAARIPTEASSYRHADPAAHWHRHADGTWHSHGHDHGHDAQQPAAAAPAALGAAHAPGTAPSRVVQIEQDLLAKNDALAARNRRWLRDRGIFALNLVSSPGSGKTTLLERTIAQWQQRTPLAVIEGDQRTTRDADRVRAAGAPAVQINTAKGCHLDAQMVAHALAQLAPAEDSLLLIENVGNLVCPAAFDLGEAHKVVILSVTEGDDKPLKYPDMFHAADLLVLNKIDLLAHVEFDVAAAIAYARRARPGLEVIEVSARTGAGFADWLAWLERGVTAARAQRESSLDGLRRRVAELEALLARREGAQAPA